jgi:hypothetical protein
MAVAGTDFGTLFGYTCAGVVVIFCILAIVYVILSGLRQFSFRKKATGTQTSLVVTANRDLFRVGVVARFGNEEIAFERRRIRKGQSVEFSYPSSKQKARLTVEAQFGHVQVCEV